MENMQENKKQDEVKDPLSSPVLPLVLHVYELEVYSNTFQYQVISSLIYVNVHLTFKVWSITFPFTETIL
ncbi:MAG: hypothetical protein ACXWE0_02785 [Nitrososphaeraceae archaeon]